MDFVVVGLNQKTAPVAIREQAFIPASAVGECVQRLVDRDLLDSGVLLSTCNRTELYAMAPGPMAAERLVDAFGEWPHQLPFDTWRRHAYQATGRPALQHVFRVAAGLESAVIGESQVLGQFKEAVSLARDHHLTDPSIEIVMRGAIRAGKRVRTETDLGRTALSVSHIAVSKADEILGDLPKRGVLVVGAGPMSRIALRLLRQHGVGSLFVASRTVERAQHAAGSGLAQAIAMGEIDGVADRIDVILSATSAPHFLLNASMIEALQRRRAGRPLLVIDMAVPRDIDPLVGAIHGVRLLNIDDLQSMAGPNPDHHRARISAAESILVEELEATEDALEARKAADVIAAVMHQANQWRDQAVERFAARLPDDDQAGKRAMRDLAHSLTARLLHQPIQALRHAQDERTRSAIGQAFGVDADDAGEH
ncbi:MAG TPA: glutamyl-tRNA reductase [Candidatus Dormibacteraeota bacterium]